MNCHCGKVALYIVNGKGKCAEHKGEEKMLFAMEVVGTSAKLGEPLGLRFLAAGAIRIMPDGVVIYHKEKFLELMEAAVIGTAVLKAE